MILSLLQSLCGKLWQLIFKWIYCTMLEPILKSILMTAIREGNLTLQANPIM